MTRTSTILLAAAIALTAAATPAEAGGYVGFEVSNHGVGMGFGGSNWGIWGSSWDSGGASIGYSATLSGYGDWVHVDGLGRVWRPWVATEWQPYTYGRWVWTSMGWTWVAYEPWGWLPHHYGNWAYSTIGWVWNPGYDYHPGNVVWVSTGVHIGWYPCAPAGWRHSYRGYDRGWNNGYSHGYSDGWQDARYATWVPRSQVTAENIADHAVRHEVATHAVARSRIAAMPVAPTRTQIEGYVGRRVPESRIVERTATVDGRNLRMVRPEGQRETVQRLGPATVERALARKTEPRTTAAGTSPSRSSDARGDRVERVERVDRATPSRSGRVETDSSIGTRRTGSAAGSMTRSTRTAPASAAQSRGPGSMSEPDSRRRAEPISAGSDRSEGGKRATVVMTRPSRPSQPPAAGARSATRPVDPQPAAPSVGRQRGAGGKPASTTASGAQRDRERTKIEPGKDQKAKRTPSRD